MRLGESSGLRGLATRKVLAEGPQCGICLPFGARSPLVERYRDRHEV